MLISEQMICREAVRIAYSLGIVDHLNENVFKCNYDVIYGTDYLNYKEYKVGYHKEDLSMSIDDFAERIIAPFVWSFAPEDIKFIHKDCS